MIEPLESFANEDIPVYDKKMPRSVTTETMLKNTFLA